MPKPYSHRFIWWKLPICLFKGHDWMVREGYSNHLTVLKYCCICHVSTREEPTNAQ